MHSILDDCSVQSLINADVSHFTSAAVMYVYRVNGKLTFPTVPLQILS